MREVARVDANQPQIVAALRAVGATVQHLHQVGRGCPDILVGFRGENFVFEIKSGRGKPTSDELDWLLKWRGQAAIVRSPEDALRLIGAIE